MECDSTQTLKCCMNFREVTIRFRLYVNAGAEVSVMSSVSLSSQTTGHALAVILKCHLCPPELLFARNAGEELGCNEKWLCPLIDC